MSTDAASTLLTLADISVLARVQRPVVSMWRKRASKSDRPFPEPVIVHGRQELFESAAVIDWLEATRRGNNPEARAEVALHAATALRAGEHDAARLDDLSVLLTLKAITGTQAQGLSSLDLADLADDADPFDLFLFSEVDSRGQELRALANVADDVASAGFTPAAALESLFRRRQQLGFSHHARTELKAAVSERVAALVSAVVDATESSTLSAPCSGSDLLVPLARLRDAELLPLLRVPIPRTAAQRLELRRLAGAGWELVPATPEIDDDVERPPTTAVVVLPSPFQPDLTTLEVIEALDDVAMTLGAQDTAVVVAPASALVEATGDRAATELRAKLLRTGRVRAILRLPAGALVAQPRVPLAVWILGPTAPAVRLEDRWVGIADLAPDALDGPGVDDLLTDVVARLGDSAAVRAHAFRFVRLTRVPQLAASNGSLLYVGRPATAPGRVDLVHARLDAQLLVEKLGHRAGQDSMAELQQLEVAAVSDYPALGGATGRARLWTLGELVAAGAVRMVPGTRVHGEHVQERADVTGSASTVIGPQEVYAGTPGNAVVDRLVIATSYPRAQLTEPGDVVACLTGVHGALVDDDGFSVALFPARALRINTEAAPWLAPHLLATAIRAAPPRTPWRAIQVPVVETHVAPTLDKALALVARARLDAQLHLERLDALADALVDGVASRAFDINFPASTPEKD